MKIERRKNASRNIVTGVSVLAFKSAIPFVLRSVMIYKLGMEYVGLDSLFVSILHVLNLAELGVGSAMVYSMYKPIAMDNSEEICALLHLYKTYYRIIGAVVLAAGLVLIPILPELISGEVPENISLYALYLINLFSTVLSYWLFAYKNSLLMAHQRLDITNKIQLLAYGVRYGVQFVALFVFENIYAYFMAVLLSQLLINLFTSAVTRKMYPQYRPVGVLSREKRKDISTHIRDLFTAKLGGTVTNSADTVVISAFLGLTVLAKYNNYYYILTALIGFITILLQSCLAGIGNSLIVETEEKNYKDFNTFTLLLTWAIGYCTAGLFCLLQPFMKIWVHEQNMLDNSYAVLFCLYFYILELAVIWSTYKDAGGIWHQDRFRPLCVTIVNLTLNLLSVRQFGLYGVIFSTIISYVCVGMPWMLYNIFTSLFHRSALKYLLKICYGFLVAAAACLVSSLACGLVAWEGILGFVVKGLIMTVVSNAVYVCCYFKTREFAEIKKILKGYTGKIRASLCSGKRK